MFSSLSTETSKNIVSKSIFILVLGLAFGGLVLADLSGVVTNGTGVQDAASVNGTRITTRTLQQKMGEMAQRLGMSPEQAAQTPQLAQYVLQGLVGETLTAQGLDKMGLRFGDDAVATEVRAMLTDPNDKSNADLVQRYEMALRNAGMTQQAFEDQIRADLAQRTVLEALRAGNLPDPLYANVQKARDAERRDIAIITIPNKASAITKKPTDQELESVYAANQGSFTIPEKRSGAVYLLTEEALKGKEDPQNLILEIEDLFAGGEKPDSVAKQYTLATGESLNDQTKDPVSDNPLRDALFALDTGGVSSGITQKNGDVAFVALTTITPETEQPLSDVKKDVVRIWKQQQANDAAQAIIAALNIAKDPIAEAKKKGLSVDTRVQVGNSEDIAPLFALSDLNKPTELNPTTDTYRLGVVTKITAGQSKWTPRAASTDELRQASEADPQETFMQLLGTWYQTAKITVNQKVLSPAPAPKE